MADHLNTLIDGINLWRQKAVGDYWVSVAYMGAAVNRLGDHDMTMVGGTLYHLWNGKWRKIETGSDYWLFSVVGTFAWARDMIKLVSDGDERLDLACNEAYGYIEFLRVKADHRDQHNFTFEVRRFGEGKHPNFDE